MSEPYRNELETLRAENSRLRAENARRFGSWRPMAKGRLAAAWVGTVACDAVGFFFARGLLNETSDRAVYLGAAIAMVLLAITTWIVAHTVRGLISNKE